MILFGNTEQSEKITKDYVGCCLDHGVHELINAKPRSLNVDLNFTIGIGSKPVFTTRKLKILSVDNKIT